ncbi:MAG: hypothetical protein WBQ73_00025 [Candidatus Babeliales bacterium]
MRCLMKTYFVAVIATGFLGSTLVAADNGLDVEPEALHKAVVGFPKLAEAFEKLRKKVDGLEEKVSYLIEDVGSDVDACWSERLNFSLIECIKRYCETNDYSEEENGLTSIINRGDLFAFIKLYACYDVKEALLLTIGLFSAGYITYAIFDALTAQLILLWYGDFDDGDDYN